MPKVPNSRTSKELTFEGISRRGDKNKKVRVIQEWLCLHGQNTGLDGDFGPATERALQRFQDEQALSVDGIVDEATFNALIAPMQQALSPIEQGTMTYPELVVAYAEQHLAEHPREIGGENRGPWIRLYMDGRDGPDWLWCAGFATFILKQAASTSGNTMPLKPSFSCDILATNAQQKGTFVAERALDKSNPPPPGSLFLNRSKNVPNDWVHTGLVTRFEDEVFETIEGNTNDDGSREGYEVCRRFRSYTRRDFISIAPPVVA